LELSRVLSALCQKRTLRYSFDYFVGAADQWERDGEAERFGDRFL